MEKEIPSSRLISNVVIPAEGLSGVIQTTTLLDSTDTTVVTISSSPPNLQKPPSPLNPSPDTTTRVPPTMLPEEGFKDCTLTMSWYSYATGSPPLSSSVTTSTRPIPVPAGTATLTAPPSVGSTSTRVLPKVRLLTSGPETSSPRMVTKDPPKIGPRLGTRLKATASLKLNLSPVFVKSSPLLLTSTDTFPGLLAGAVHMTILAESCRVRLIVCMPNLHMTSLPSMKLFPTNVTLDPPVAGAYDGMTCER